jgi:hypothetical protein
MEAVRSYTVTNFIPCAHPLFFRWLKLNALSGRGYVAFMGKRIFAYIILIGNF